MLPLLHEFFLCPLIGLNLFVIRKLYRLWRDVKSVCGQRRAGLKDRKAPGEGRERDNCLVPPKGLRAF
ncbi:hypothetical protein BQ8794_130206 [Mesorhizobium prunaredense]|uniref:Uncharacterized protein n=1 Tax=Mesorhizobium prunaredense TaxID=1631249 RepID=A0A1R3V1E2_9HYPH|nr:hypothetical protein BQ8794_130206 [Mesorhizobium prunaredense]